MQSSQALDKPLQMAIEWTEILIILKNNLPPKNVLSTKNLCSSSQI